MTTIYPQARAAVPIPALSGFRRSPPVAITPIIADLLRRHAPVAIGISGGKDSQAAAIATFEHLDRIGHAGPRLLIHADRGVVEWKDSLPVCERLAETLDTELVVVCRKQGGLLERWEGRWRSNVARYEDLGTVTLVPCWSTPSMRFCTSELKTTKIHAELLRGFKGAADHQRCRRAAAGKPSERPRARRRPEPAQQDMDLETDPRMVRGRGFRQHRRAGD